MRTKDGALHALDVAVLATGLHVDWLVRPMQLAGREGIRLDDVSARGATAYMSVTVPGSPASSC